jgi:hypothetical protein
MNGRTPARCAIFLFILVNTVFSVPLFAQVVCDEGNGPLNPAQPSGMTPDEIIQRFATKETTFKAAREHYGYTLDVTIETLDGSQINGAYRQVSEIMLNDQGARVEKPTFAPQNTLREITMTKDDLDDIHDRLPFPLTTEDLQLFSLIYVGRQHVDELDTYVFDVAPKNVKKEKSLFQGRVWVDDRDLMIVKTCGKTRRDENVGSRNRNAPANLTPEFVTYREQIDGKFWFPTYSRADEVLHFPRRNVHIREIVKYSNYKPFVSH